MFSQIPFLPFTLLLVVWPSLVVIESGASRSRSTSLLIAGFYHTVLQLRCHNIDCVKTQKYLQFFSNLKVVNSGVGSGRGPDDEFSWCRQTDVLPTNSVSETTLCFVNWC